MSNIYQEKPKLFVVILGLLLIGLIESFIHAKGNNYLAETCGVITFFIVIGLWSYFIETNRCLYKVLIILFSGAITGIVYWYAISFELELWKSILYCVLSALIWIFIESLGDKEFCK